jgi:arylsulfatase
MEGVSVAPLLGNKQLDRQAIYWEHEGNRAVRKDNWKLVSKYPGNWELFDMETDRTEMNDLSLKNQGKINELSTLWESWAEKCKVENWEDVRKGVVEFGKKYNNRYAPGQTKIPRAD